MDHESPVSADLVLVALSAPRSRPPPAHPRRATRAGPPPGGPVRSTPERTSEIRKLCPTTAVSQNTVYLIFPTVTDIQALNFFQVIKVLFHLL